MGVAGELAPMRQSTLQEHKAFGCEICGKELNTEVGRKIHQTRVHGNGAKKTYVCDRDGCDNTFENYPSRLEGRGREKFYCSRECQNKGQKSGEMVTCAWCGDEVYKQDCMLDSMGDYDIDNHFCDKECETQFKRHNWVRDGHPNWQGGNSGINAIRKMLSPVSWQETARNVRKDSGGCYVCGGESKSRDLDVHHIIPVASGGTNGEWNLMALCQSCHRRVERYTEQIVKPHLYDLSRQFSD